MAKDKKAKATNTEKPAPEAAKPGKTAARSAGERIAEGMQNAGANLRGAADEAARNTAKINVTVIDQVEANTRAAFAAMRAAASAGSLSEVVKVQRDYVKDQGERSVAQAREIGDLIAQFGRNAISQVTSRKS